MSKIFSVGSVARLLDVPPTKITSLFYRKILPGHEAPIVGGRRVIEAGMIPRIVEALEARGTTVRREALAS